MVNMIKNIIAKNVHHSGENINIDLYDYRMGKIHNTFLIAGENNSGKSSLFNAIYSLWSDFYLLYFRDDGVTDRSYISKEGQQEFDLSEYCDEMYLRLSDKFFPSDIWLTYCRDINKLKIDIEMLSSSLCIVFPESEYVFNTNDVLNQQVLKNIDNKPLSLVNMELITGHNISQHGWMHPFTETSSMFQNAGLVKNFVTEFLSAYHIEMNYDVGNYGEAEFRDTNTGNKLASVSAGISDALQVIRSISMSGEFLNSIYLIDDTPNRLSKQGYEIFFNGLSRFMLQTGLQAIIIHNNSDVIKLFKPRMIEI